MKKISLNFDDYFGEWVIIDKRIWYKTKYLTFLTYSKAKEAYNKTLNLTSPVDRA